MFSLGYKTGLSFWVFVTNDLEQATSPEFPVTASNTMTFVERRDYSSPLLKAVLQ